MIVNGVRMMMVDGARIVDRGGASFVAGWSPSLVRCWWREVRRREYSGIFQDCDRLAGRYERVPS